MENHLGLVREGKTITHHFGWQDYNRSRRMGCSYTRKELK